MDQPTSSVASDTLTIAAPLSLPLRSGQVLSAWWTSLNISKMCWNKATLPSMAWSTAQKLPEATGRKRHRADLENEKADLC